MTSKRVAIVDYGAGNIASVKNALNAVGALGICISNPSEIFGFNRVLVPGVGAFGDAMLALKKSGFASALCDYAKSTQDSKSSNALLGICLGMQLLFDVSYEFGEHAGLGILRGEVQKLKAKKIPHIGWNTINFTQNCALNAGLRQAEFLYFVHSFCVCPLDSSIVLSTTDYEQNFVSAIASGRVFGLQPHPEKSHNVGLKILENFINMED